MSPDDAQEGRGGALSARRPGASSERAAIWVPLAVASALRLLWALLVPVIPVSDTLAYDAFATTLVEHGVFGWTPEEPGVFWPPGTTFFHAIAYAVFGTGNYGSIVGLNLLFSLGSIWLTSRLTNRFIGPNAARCAVWILALWPTLIMYSTVLASELPSLFLTLGAIDLWTGPRSHLGRAGTAISSGFVLGLGSLVRPTALLLGLVLALSVWVRGGLSKRVLKDQLIFGLIAAAAMVLTVAPWTWRNYEVYGEFIPIATNGRIVLWMGNTPGTSGSYKTIPEGLEELPHTELARELGDRAVQNIIDNPGAFAVRFVEKAFLLFGNESIGVIWNEPGIASTFGESAVLPLKRFTQVTWFVIFGFFLGGVVLSVSREGWRFVFSPLFSSLLYLSLPYCIAVAQNRYHLSFAGQIAAFCGVGLFEALRFARSMKSQ